LENKYSQANLLLASKCRIQKNQEDLLYQ